MCLTPSQSRALTVAVCQLERNGSDGLPPTSTAAVVARALEQMNETHAQALRLAYGTIGAAFTSGGHWYARWQVIAHLLPEACAAASAATDLNIDPAAPMSERVQRWAEMQYRRTKDKALRREVNAIRNKAVALLGFAELTVLAQCDLAP